MSSRSKVLANTDFQLSTYSELVQWASDKDRPVTEVRYAFVEVFSYRTQIAKSGVFRLGFENLADTLTRMSRFLGYNPHELSFKLTSWRIENQWPVVSTTLIGSQLQFQFSIGSVAVSLRPRGYELIILSINSSVSQVRRKTNQAPKGGFSRIKFLRPLETRTIPYTQIQCLPTGCTTTPFSKKVFERGYSSVRTPNFMALKKKGQLPPQPYTLQLVDVDAGFFSSSKVWTGQDWFIDLQISANPNLLFTDFGTGHLGIDENLLIAKLAGKINSSRSNLAESLVQGNQTVRLISDSTSRFATFLSLILGGEPAAVRKFLGSAKGSSAFVRGLSQMRRGGLSGVALLAQLWLEYRYGWLPLVSDVDASIAALKALGSKNPGIISVAATRRKTTNTTTKTIYATNPNGSPRTRYVTSRVTTVCKIGVRYRLDSKLVSSLSGLGLTSPIALSWELVPFSFLVDWFLPIGPALQAFSAFEGLTFMSGYKTYFTKQDRVLYVHEKYTHVDSNPLNSYVLLDRGACSGHRVTMNRSVLSNFPGPKLPMFKSPFSFIHAANAAALVARALTGKR